MIVSAIGRAVGREDLSEELAKASMEQILAGEATAAQIAALAISLRMKGETAEEIAGMARAMRQRVPPLRTRRSPLMDTCGTGGSEPAGGVKFNISTTVAIVTASCGVAVAKHGNRAVSSRTGSADVLEALGVRVDLTPESAGRSIDNLGITFLFAPNYHSAMRNAAGVRREMGVRTVFNLLGPITNPAGATRQLLGVYADEYVSVLAEVLRRLGSERAMIVHGSDGMDELTVFGKSHVAELRDGKVREYAIDPKDFGLAHTDRAGVAGGSPQENAARVRAVLSGAKGPARDIVLLNAGAALHVAGVAGDLATGIERARSAIDRGEAARKLDELASFRG
jgi:anthranilate phosphoribosyltransferase